MRSETVCRSNMRPSLARNSNTFYYSHVPDAMTKPFLDACAEAEELIRGAPFIKTEQDLIDGLDYLAGSIRASLQLAWAYDKDRPFFVNSTNQFTKMGLDNPDTVYYHAYLRSGARYIVR